LQLVLEKASLSALFGDNLFFISLIREDFVSQAISLYKATKTGLWHTTSQKLENFINADGELEYSREEIKRWLKHILDQEYGAEKLFKSMVVEPLRLTYEKLVANTLGCVKEIATYIGVVLPDNFSISTTRNEKIGTSLNKQFKERFMAEEEKFVQWCYELRGMVAAYLIEKEAKKLPNQTTKSQQSETMNVTTPPITANYASSNLRTKVKLYDLGNSREEYKGILSPVYDDEVVKKYITEQFLGNASIYANRYQHFDYWEWLLRTAQQHLSLNNLEALRILDIGSGAGNTISPLFKLFPNASIVASDLSVPLLKIFKDLYEKDYGARTCTIIQLNAEEIVFEDNQFDLVVGGAILHHLLSPERAIKECFRVLKPQGYAVFFEPFESGNSAVASVLLKLLELNELFHQQDEPLTPEIVRFFKAWCHDVDVRKKMSEDSPLLQQLDDKWLFTKQYFQNVSESVGGEVVIYSISDMTKPFSNTIKVLIKLGLQLEGNHLPKWVIDYILEEEEKFLRESTEEAMMKKGCIIFHKAKPRAKLAFQPKYHSQSEENMTSLVNTIFELPKILKPPYSWVEHIPFAFFLVHTLKPRVLVELGVYVGNSYNAFCQAISLLKTATQCYGIDTWRGDEHTNFYDESIYNELFAYQQREYQGFSSLLRMTFDEARSHFADGTIDLLHIDGFHTYDAVKHDFDNWLPKVSDQGVVIFHDTEVREQDFGVWRL